MLERKREITEGKNSECRKRTRNRKDIGTDTAEEGIKNYYQVTKVSEEAAASIFRVEGLP
jgi:hypothetical protein